jgi:protein SCO1/2
MTARRLLMVLAVGVAAALAGAWLGSRLLVPQLGSAPAQTLTAGTLLPQRRALTPFALTDTDGAALDPAALQGRWTLLAFGEAVRFVFVSVDPERDDLSRLKEYVRYFNPAFVGATGPHPELQRLTRQLGVMYQRAPGEESALGYLVDHTASMLLIDPQARLTALFSTPHDAAAIAADIAGLVDGDR